ncbi:MAG: hypothetical protein KGL39_12310 [Patescibacteria group bacterium]|nr:hypothetical protein [Patescibacteria group bacterium]
MTRRHSSVKDDILNAERLEEHVRNLNATNREQIRRSWFDRRLDRPTFFLAVSGAVVYLAGLLLAVWPLALISYHYWVK